MTLLDSTDLEIVKCLRENGRMLFIFKTLISAIPFAFGKVNLLITPSLLAITCSQHFFRAFEPLANSRAIPIVPKKSKKSASRSRAVSI